MRNAFVKRLSELAQHDPRVMLITGDLGFSVLDDFQKTYPEQFINAGVAEQNMTGLATGLALEGRVVFTYSIANFCTLRCLEQIRNDASYHDANVKVVSVGGGFSYGQLGMSHHATEDLAILRAIPGITVVSPSTLWEATQATEAVLNQPGTCYLRLDKSFAPDARAPSEKFEEKFELGRARLMREGADLTLIATGGILSEALKAAERLEQDQIRCRVLSIHTLKPLDQKSIIAAARETGGIITVEEHVVDGGLGGAVAETLLENDAAPRFFRRIGLRAGFSSIVGSQDYLRAAYGMNAEAIYTCALKALRKKEG